MRRYSLADVRNHLFTSPSSRIVAVFVTIRLVLPPKPIFRKPFFLSHDERTIWYGKAEPRPSVPLTRVLAPADSRIASALWKLGRVN